MFETSLWMQIRGGNRRTALYAAPYADNQAILLIMTIDDGAMFQDYSCYPEGEKLIYTSV